MNSDPELWNRLPFPLPYPAGLIQYSRGLGCGVLGLDLCALRQGGGCTSTPSEHKHSTALFKACPALHRSVETLLLALLFLEPGGKHRMQKSQWCVFWSPACLPACPLGWSEGTGSHSSVFEWALGGSNRAPFTLTMNVYH